MNSSEKSQSGSRSSLREARADRLARALRANIGRRKAQARGRDAQADQASGDRAAEPADLKDEP